MACRLRVLILALAVGAAAPASAQDAPHAPAAGAPLAAFETDAALAAFGQDLADWQQRLDEERAATQARCTSAQAIAVFPNAVQPTALRSAVISGQVVEADGVTTVIGANVRIGGTDLAAATDIDGRFRRFVDSTTVASAGSRRLVASYAGYHSAFADVEIGPGDSVSVSFTLCDGGGVEEVTVTYAPTAADASSGDAESITNVQHAGVDEGGIVKRHGDHLVILRRGRLFTVDVSGRDLRPVDAVDAFGPGIDPGGAWHDEMLVVRETVVVIGYSYARQGTEVGLFEIDGRGRLRHRNTYHLRSNDYYSSRNYTARLVGGRLVFYTPLAAPARAWAGGPAGVLPALSRWTGDRTALFVPIATATRVFRPARALTDPHDIALHTVTSCAIDRGALDCEATAVFGPFRHTFYTSPEAVYVWLSGWAAPQDEAAQDDGQSAAAAPSVLYRLPLDGSAPRALGVAGGPTDQFSFLEADGHLQVLVSEDGDGQWMWGSERDRSGLALLRVPLALFGDGAADAPRAAYRPLPEAGEGPLANRFVGGHAIYGSAPWNGERQASRAHVVDWRTGAVASAEVPHGVERIEAMGDGAVLVGSGGADLYLSALRLGAEPRVVSRYAMMGAAQGESRSHGYFYRPTDGDRGLLGLPVRRAGAGRYESLWDGSAAVLYVENRRGALSELGELAADPDRNADDGCRASCVDWYGNARPLFIGGRVFALMGYELVEGEVRRGRLREVRRASFAPRARAAVQ